MAERYPSPYSGTGPRSARWPNGKPSGDNPRRLRFERPAQLRAPDAPQRLPASPARYPGRHGRCRDPKLRAGTYFPHWLLERCKRAETALITVVADLLPRGRLHPPDAQAGEDARHPLAVEVAGLAHGGRARRARRAVPAPAAGSGRTVHVRRRRCADDEGPRGRPRHQRRRAHRDRRERRWPRCWACKSRCRSRPKASGRP